MENTFLKEHGFVCSSGRCVEVKFALAPGLEMSFARIRTRAIGQEILIV